MAQRAEVAAVYGAGVVQGVALVTFPAASAVFTSPQYYGLSSTQYGAMFVPRRSPRSWPRCWARADAQPRAPSASFCWGWSPTWSRWLLLVLSQFAIGHGSLAYLMLLARHGEPGPRLRA